MKNEFAIVRDTIATNDLIKSNETVEIKFTSTYTLPLSWLTDDEGLIDIKREQNFNGLIVNYFRGQFFSDAFGRVPADSFKLQSIEGHEELIRELDKRIQSLDERKSK